MKNSELKRLMSTIVAEANKDASSIHPSWPGWISLDIMSRKLLAGKLKGERRSKRRGQSVEFADYRDYVDRR